MDLGKSDITGLFARNKPRKVKRVQVSEDQHVWIRALTLGDRNTRLEIAKRGRSQFNTVGYYLVASLCDEKGNPLFSDGEADEMDELPSDFVEVVFREILDFNGLSKEAQDFFVKPSSQTPNSNGNLSYANGAAVA